MRISLFNDIFRQPWMIDPQTAAAQRQVLIGMLSGLEFTSKEKPGNKTFGHKENALVPQGRVVNVVNLKGVMLRDDGDCGEVGTRTLGSILLNADQDPNVIGHIISVDSGGGAFNSVAEIADAIRLCSKPVVAHVDGFMCSAAMYAASYCDYIIANRETDRVGCIGVMIELADWPKQVKSSDGYIRVRVYADGAEEKNGEYEAAIEGDFKLLKEHMLNPLNEIFKKDIRANRPDVRDDQLKGRTYFAKDAVGTLVDEIGSFDTAIAKVIELSNINITKMEGLEHLQEVPGCADLTMVDNSVNLNKEQLEAVDAAIATEKALVQTKDKTIGEQADKINQLTTENASLKTTNESQATEIASLKSTIEELNKKPTPPAQAVHNGDHNTDALPFENDPEGYCHDLLKRMGN